MGGTVVAAPVGRVRAERGPQPAMWERAQRAIVALPVMLLAAMAWRVRWVSDDGFINLRVVEQMAWGNGPVFNAGERIEASTSALWVALLALVHPLPGSMPWKAVLLGIVLSVVGLLAAQRCAIALARPQRDQLVLPVGALAVACLPPFWDFATSGLETGLTFAWLGGSCWWCARRVTADRMTADRAPGTRAELAGAALVGLGVLIRPDLALFSMAFGAVLLAAVWLDGRWARRRVAAALLALPVAHQLFRMGYYALLMPNTALAKEAGRAQWGQGVHYLTDFVTPYLLWWPLLALGAVLVHQVRRDLGANARTRAAARAAPAAAALVHALYLTRMGGDFMHARLLLPAAFGLLAPVGVTVPVATVRHALRHPWASLHVEEHRRHRLAVGVTVAVVGWGLVCTLWLRPHYPSAATFGVGILPGSADGTIEDERNLFRMLWRNEHPGLDRAVAAGPAIPSGRTGRASVLPDGDLQPVEVRLDPGIDAEAAAPQFAIGRLGLHWGPDVYVIDLQSLAHPIGGHLDELIGSRPGHQKLVPLVWQVVTVSPAGELRADGRLLLSADDAAAARRALGCGQLGRYMRDIRAPLTPGRFLGNIVDSVGNTLFRVPVDPADAERRFCDRPS